MAAKDYYKVLGVDKSASKEEIKRAYKTLAKKYHPDLNKAADAADRFKELNEAAAVLGDEKKRSHYDQFGTADFGSQSSEGFSGFDFRDFHAGFDFDDIFDNFFGGSRRRKRGPQQGDDIEDEIEITLEEASAGVEKHMQVLRLETCKECDGSGAKSERHIKTCSHCHGTGTMTRQQRTPFGIFQSTSICSQCHGQGKEIEEPCSECDGQGKVRKERTITVEIPAGVDTGSRLRVAGAGQAGDKGASLGDLYLYISVQEHEIFKRDGLDIYTEIPLSFRDCCLGAEVDVPTLEGKAKLTIPVTTKANTVFRLKGKGMPSLRGFGKGDELVKVVIDVPKKLTKKQKQLLEEFDKEVKVEKGLFEKIKDAF